MKTINAKSVTKNNAIDYEFRVQTGNGSRLDGTNEPVIVELTDEHGNVTQIPLQHSINNSKAFQKGQLDIFHLALPENFHSVCLLFHLKINNFTLSHFSDKKIESFASQK